MNKELKRNETFDLLKGIAVILMIQVHILELFATPQIFYSLTGKLSLFLGGPPVAPVFMFVFGYFVAKSRKSATALIKRGLAIFALGMLLNLGLNLNLIISVLSGRFDIDLWPYIFGVDILHLAGLSITVLAILRKLFEKQPVLSVLAMISVAFLGHFLLQFQTGNVVSKYLFSYFYGASHWSYFPLFPWLAYPLLGLFFYNMGKHLKPITGKLWISAAAVASILYFAFTFKFAVLISSSLPHYYNHGLIFFMWTIVFILFYAFFMNETNRLLGHTKLLSYIKWTGKNVTAIYVVQWLIIGNLATEIYKTVNEPLLLGLYFSAILLGSSLLVFGYERLRVKG